MTHLTTAYSPELRDRILALAREGQDVRELAWNFELSERTIQAWLQAAGPVERTSASTAARAAEGDHDELRRLRRENLQLRRERDALVKNAAWLAQAAWFGQGDATPEMSSTP